MRNRVFVVLSFVASASILQCQCMSLGSTIEDASSKEREQENEMIPACKYSFDHGVFEMKTFDTKNKEMNCSLKNGDSEGADERKEVLMKNKENKTKVRSNDPFDEKCEDCANTENLRVSGKGNGFGRSEMKGCVVLKNSSVLLRGLGMGCGDGKGIACAWSESEIAMDGCGVIVEGDVSPLDLKGSCATLVNISLKTSKTQFPQIPPLFASNPSEDRLQCFGRVSICSSRFSSMALSSAPFFSSPSIESASLSNMVFSNISTFPSTRGSISTYCWKSSILMDGCLFSSVRDVYDGGIIQSINSPLSSLVVSNTSFVGCCRTRNVEFIGSEDNKKSPGRQNLTDNGANTFTWCEWNGSKANGTNNSYSDGVSSGGAIGINELNNGSIFVSHCSFNDCYAYYAGGAVMCNGINSVEIESCLFNTCIAPEFRGGGIYAYNVSSCIRISGCEFLKCEAFNDGGGLNLHYFHVSGSDCIEADSGKGESACVFECNFTSCSTSESYGGGIHINMVPVEFKMRSLRFTSCSTVSYGGGFCIFPNQRIAPSNNLYFYFFFFHDCRCTTTSTPYGHDAYFSDDGNFFSSNNPFYESYTTNANDTRVCYYGNKAFKHAEKKWWLKDKTIYVSDGGNDSYELCGANETYPCLTVEKALKMCEIQVSLTITVLGGRHASEENTISVGEKKISIVGRGKTVSVIGTNSLSSPATPLFSISSGQLEVEHVGIDHNATRSPSPSVFVVTDGSGSLSLEDVLISGIIGGSVISASVFEVALRQLKMVDVEIKNIKMNQPLFAEPSSAGSSSGESLLGNVTIRNVNRTTGDGVVMAKSAKGGETFVVWNTTIEGCECLGGNGGGIKVELSSSSSKVRIGDSTSHSGGATAFNRCSCRGYGGGVMLFLADNSFDFTISSVSFVGCSATSGGKDVYVNGSRLVSGTITATKLNFSRNVSIYDELMGYDRNEIGMGIFPLNVFLETFSGAAHVGKEVNGCGGYDSWFCGFGYFPCSTIAFAAQNRFSSSKKNIVLDPGFELGEVVSMAGSYEWEVYCGINKTNVNVWLPSGMTSSYLINVQSASSIKNIGFQIPFSLSSATSLITSTSSSLTLTDCSVAHSSESTSSVNFGYSIVNAQSGSLNMERFVISGALVFGAHSAIEFCEGMGSVICSGCNISGVKRNEGDGGWMKGTVGTSGTLTVDGCDVNGCSCVGGKGGGMYVGLKGNGKVVVNGSSVIDGNKAENNGGRGGRGGGMFVLMENGGCGLTIGQNVEFSKVKGNVASFGKDVFVDCGSGVFLESKVNTDTFAFFDSSTIPSDVLKLSGSENGDESGVIPLFVYLCSMETKVIVDGSGGNGMDHNHCGFDGFRCLTVDYCANSRMSSTVNEIEIVSSSSITKEITGPSFGVSISGRITSSAGERMGVNVSDGGSATQDYLVGYSNSLAMRRLSFIVKSQLNSRRKAFIHSTSTLSVTNCSASFESGAMTDGKIGYSIIDMAGGNLIVDRLVIESGVTLTMNGKSPITMTSGVRLEMLNSRMSGVEVEVAGGNGGGGCLNVGMGDDGNVKIEECNLSSTCSGGNEMKGGGLMISVGKGGMLSSEAVNGGRGLGGGMFAELADQMGRFSLESMAFCGCNAWKGKNLFVEAQDLSAVINSTSIGFNPEIRINHTDFNELCGRERNKPKLIVPLVVFLRTFSSPAYVSGREQGSELRLCGYEDYACRTIEEASEYRYPSSKRNIRLKSTFSFDEEVQLNKQSFEIDSSNKNIGIRIGGTSTKTQEALVMNSVLSTLTGILFELGGSIGGRSSFVHSTSGTLKFADCGIKMGSGVDSVNYVFVSASGGKVEIIWMSCGESVGEVRFGGCVIVVNGSGECTMDEVIINQTISNGVNGLIEIAASSSATIQNCSIANCDLPSCGVIQVEKCSSITLKNISFENITRGKGDGGCLCLRSNGDGSKDTMKIENCTFRMCKVNENGKGGGGLSVSLENPSELYVSSTRFEKCYAPSMSGSEGKGGGIFLSLMDAGARFELSGDLIFDGNEAEYGRNVFIESGDLERSVTGEHIKFVIALSDLSVEAMGMDGKWRDVVIPLKFYLAEKLNRIKMGDEGKDVVVCGFDELRCKTVGYGARRLEGQERYLEFGERYEMKEIVELDGVEGYHFCGVLTKTNMEMVGNGFGGDWMMDVSTSSATFERICFVVLCSQPSSVALAQTKIFCVSGSNGTLIIERCSVESKTREGECSCSFACVRSGRLSIFDFSMNHAKFGLNPFVVVDINGEGSIENALLESVETTNAKGLIEYSSSSSSLTIVNVTAQERVMGGKGLIWDDNGKKLRMRNCTIMKTCSLEGNGSVVSGEVGDGCAVEVKDVVIEGCGTLNGCGGGMAVILKGTGEMRLGKSEMVTSFEKCSAGGEGSVGGYGGGVLLRCEEGGSDFMMSELAFGTGEGANTAAHGGNNVFVEGTDLPQLVNRASFNFSFEIEGDGFNIKDLMGAEDGNELKLIPVVVFFREKPSVGYVNGGSGGMNYHRCGYSDFACSTLIYAGTNMFGVSPATLKLVDGSSIFDEMTLNIQQMNIDGDIPKAKIGINDRGEGGNEFLIKSEQAISFSSLVFSISTFAESRKECVFLCSSSTLKFEGCSFGAESQEIGVGLICGKGGKVELVRCEFGDFAMTKSGMVTFDGAGVEGLIDEVIVRNVTRENEGRSLFELRNGDVEIKNTTMNESRFDDGNEIEIGEGINTKFNNCSFKSIQRENGNGGVLNGRVGSGKCVDINKCVFEECKCESMSAIGGGIVMIVGDGGKLLFDDNKMNGCTVSDRSGKGGGMHLTFETTNIEYSMKNDDFANNVAEKGEDVYLVCGSPWRMLLPAFWDGTTTRITAENKMWVLESFEQRKEDSLINYLFPRLGTNLFVSNAGNELSSCGVKENPCSSVDIGFDRLNDEIERIVLVGAASVSKTINRKVKGLTIEGNEETRELVVKEGGKFELTEGDGQTHLTLSLLQISLPCSSSASASGDESIVEVRTGECFILDCLFSGGEGNSNVNSNVNECGKWIVIGNGGVIHIERTEMNGITFEGCGIARFGGGNAIFKNCALNGIETSGGGVIVGNGGSEVTLRNMTALGCVVGAGSLITLNGGSSLRVGGESRFENIETESVSGGCVKSEMKLNDLLEIGSSSILKCSANGNGGRGGGIYLDLSDNCVNNFSLSTLTFEGNVATEGRDLFISCKKLNETVTKERFGFEYKYENGEGEWMEVDMKGIDRDNFAESVDLGLFLVEMKGMEVCVSREGYDTLGCGSDGHPCESMWSGISHIDRSGTEGERKVYVKDEGTIEDIYSFTDALAIEGCVNEGDTIKHKPVQFNERIKGNSASSSTSVISSTVSLSLLSLKLQIPNQFEPKMNSLISSSGALHLVSCLFENQSSDIIQYSLISTTTGRCTLKGCSLKDCSFAISPLMMASSVLLENNNFSNIKNTGSGEEGGLAKVTLKNDEDLIIKSTNASSCSLSEINGKGGFLYLDYQNCLNEKPFLFDVGVTFENNNAAIGKNLFILGKDFNSSVTNESFKFDYSTMINDCNLFVGSDDFHQEKDLFMFLIPYASFEIFISSEGYDVVRCGSEEEPCFTVWKGMENMKKEIGKKTIQIEGSTFIRDSFNMSNYQIKKSVKMGEEDIKAILNFEKAIGSQLEYFMENYNHLELSNIQLQLVSGFDNSAKTIISNINGDLVITGCSFHSEAEVNNGFDCVFVDMIGGNVKVNDFSMELCNVGNNIFVIHDSGITCHFVNVRVESLNESRGCILSIKKSEAGLKINEGVNEECVNIEIEKSSFSGVKKSDNGPSILESKNEKKICFVVNSSNITEDKAEMSEKGGAIFFTLGASGSMKMIESTISHCICNSSTGRGGGVYLETKERGELDFTFEGMKFSNNEASVGNDIFIECFNITSQINESQFQFDLRENYYSRINAIYGRDECDYPNDTDLIGFVTIHQSDTIIVSSVNGSDEKQCGTNALPCYSIDHGLMHLTSDFMSQMIVVDESVIGGEINLEEMSLSSKRKVECKIEMKSGIDRTKDSVISTTGEVSLLRVSFVFDSNFISQHESLISPEGGILEVMNCSFSSKQLTEGDNEDFANIPFHIINMKKGELQLDGCTISNLILQKSALYLSSSLPSVIDSLTFCNSTIKASLIDINECGKLNMDRLNTRNISVKGNEESLISCLTMKKAMELTNCTIGGASSNKAKGKLMKLKDCTDAKMDNCIFDRSSNERNDRSLNEKEEMCRWDGSLVDIVKSSVLMKDTTISNSSEGGITMSGGNVIIEKGEFLNNNPSIEGYPSLRRNIICSDSGTLNVMSLKGGDGILPNTSLWMLNEGCSFEGIVSERDSSFFIPVLESVEAIEEIERMKLTFKGLLLVPCNLSFSVVKRKGEEKEIEKHDFDSNGFLSEKEVEGSVGKDLINSCGDEIEVSVHVLFGNEESPSSTQSFILKNASGSESKGDEQLVEGGKEGKSYWLLIVIVLVVILLIVLIVSIILAVRWRKQKRRTEELEIIVEDNIKKDPKAFEMVTMEMSPEEQWRRAEREAEKKNEERIKKRMNGKEMVHSESEEYLLSESGSTEYILGKDSDKIPDWALEKEEEEETRKRTPSPSISSTSTTDTSDTDTTFVRSESLCPTTSSMSNLVDAIACSSPHEKLIVDLRDSLFMLLHGRNEKKEMAIGSLQEREQTAAQILFWVANGALHSFDEMENPLSSLENLSPHIVLFSEHMVICIVMHFDCSSSDSDSSSISSSTIVTSSSDGSRRNKRCTHSPPPSSAFEDDEDNRNECLRWKAPELMSGAKKHATKKTVAFSIGMMLWECLTLDVPFGEYEAEVAGKKIMNGERPCLLEVSESSFCELVKGCFWQEANERIGLESVKRECLGHFPKEKLIMTISDGIYIQNGRIVRRSYVESGDEESEERQTIKIVLPGKIVE